MKSNSGFSRRSRRGTAFLMLVVLVLLVIVGATRVLVTSEVSARRNEVSRLRGTSMNAAIDAALQAGIQSGEPIRLPVDLAESQWIDVSMKDNVVSALWFSGGSVQDEVQRKIEAAGLSGGQD